MKVEIKTITPEIALEMLKCNIRNRRLDANIVLSYADMMIKGKWKPNGDAIRFSNSRVLLDGQHRLSAIVKSRKPQNIIIVSELEDEVFGTIDQQKTRTAGDILGRENIKNSNYISAIITKYFGLKSRSYVSKSGAGLHNIKKTKIDILEEYKEYSDLYNEIFEIARKCNSKIKLQQNSTIGGYIAYLVKEKKHKLEKVKSFFEQLYFGVDVENETINVLRDKLTQDAMSKYKMTDKMKHAMIVKTWNSYIKGSVLKRITFDVEKEIMPEMY